MPAVTLEVVDERLAPPAILTFVQLTLVYFLLAEVPTVARPTLTEVSVHLVQTGGSILTWLVLSRTIVDIYLTVSAIVARLAVAPVVINQVFARASRLTGVIFTIVDILKNKCMVSVKAEAMLRCLTWEQFLPEYPGLQ